MQKYKSLILNLILIIGAFLIGIINVHALDNEYLGNIKFKNDFNSKIDGFALNTIKTSDGGYIVATSNITNDASYFFKTDASGNVLWTGEHNITDVLETSNGNIFGISSENVYLYNSSGEFQKEISLYENSLGHPGGRSVFEFGDNYVIVGLESKYASSDNSNIVVTEVDADGNVLNNVILPIVKVETDSCNDNGGCSYVDSTNYIGSYYGATVNNDELYLFASNNGNMELITINENLEYTRTILDTSSLTETALNNVRLGLFTSLDVNGNDVYFATSYGVFVISDNKIELKLASSESGIDGLDLTSMVIYNDMIIVGGLSEDGEDKLGTIVVYDMNFNKLDMLYITDIFAKESEFSLVKGLSIQGSELVVSGMFAEQDRNGEFADEEKAFLLVYNIGYNINTKTDGRGKITASRTSARNGEMVTFTITPDEGYIVKEVKVTDANGNVVIFTSGSFTMPSADVTIEATFELEKESNSTISEIIENPSTGISSPIGIALIGLIGVGIFLLIKRASLFHKI